MNILALQLKRIGDAVLTAPALAAVRARHPCAWISLVLEGAAADLAPGFTSVDEVLVYRRHRPNLGVWTRAGGGPFGFCLDFTGSDRSAAIAFLSRADARAGYAQFCARHQVLGRVYNVQAHARARDMPTVGFHLALASAAGACLPGARSDPDAPAGFIPPPGLALPDLPDRFALVHPGTARPEKFWYPERWARVIEHLVGERGLECVVTGAGIGDEANHLAAVKRASRVRFTDLAGRLDLLQLSAAAARAQVVLTVDSAAAHLAAAVRAPQIALFGPTNPFHWAPRHRRALVVTAAGDRVLPPDGMAPRAPGAPMRGLSTSTVIRATGSLLAP